MRWIWYALLSVACSLGAYAGVQKQVSPANPAELAATHGFVRASIPQPELAVTFALCATCRKANLLDPKNVLDMKSRLTLTERLGARSFGAWVPAGEYQLTLGTADPLRTASGKPYTPVMVRAGEVTDLGVFLQVNVGGYQYRLVPVDDAGTTREAEQVIEKFGPVLKSRDLIRWRPTELPQLSDMKETRPWQGLIPSMFDEHERNKNMPTAIHSLTQATTIEEFLSAARMCMPPRAEEPAADDLGNLYYGADLGVVRVRDGAGRWSARNTGSHAEVTAMDFFGGRLIAGDFLGQLQTSTDGGITWTLAPSLGSAPSPIPAEVILDIEHNTSRWFVLAAQFRHVLPLMPMEAHALDEPARWSLSATLRIYSGVRPDLTDSALLHEVTVPKPLSVLAHIRGLPDYAGSDAVDGAYVVHSSAGIERLDLATMQWTQLTRPEVRNEFVHVSRDGKALVAVQWAEHRRSLTYSWDGGITWKKHIYPPANIYDLELETARVGRASAWWSGRFSDRLHFYEVDAEDREWKKVGEAPETVVQMLRDAQNDLRFGVTRHGEILRHENGSWQTEFAPE